MLTFQLQRVNYDVKRKEAVKLNNQFVFDKVIYLDRYMHCNERETARRRERVAVLQAEIKTMEEEIATYEQKETMPICDQIANVAELLRTFANHTMEIPEIVCATLSTIREQVSLRIQGL
jgi:CRISPR/Cas system CSM-associated protein Csm5 (group 7 of RAMP superfamily)